MWLTYIPLILGVVLTNALAQIFLKKGMLDFGTFEFAGHGLAVNLLKAAFSPFVFLGLFTMVVSMGAHLMVLSRVPLSYAYPFLSISYVVVLAVGYYFFDEHISWTRIAGVGLICAGTVLVAQS